MNEGRSVGWKLKLRTLYRGDGTRIPRKQAAAGTVVSRTFHCILSFHVHYHFDVRRSKSDPEFCEELSTLRPEGGFAGAYNSVRDGSRKRQIRRPIRPMAPAHRSAIIGRGVGLARNRLCRGLWCVSISCGHESTALWQRERRTLRRGVA